MQVNDSASYDDSSGSMPVESTGLVVVHLPEEDVNSIRKNLTEGMLSPTEDALITAAYSILSLAGFFGNLLVIIAVLRNSDMRTSGRFFFIMNLAVADLLVSMTLIPLVRVPQVQVGWYYGEIVCKFFNGFLGTNVYCSVLTVVAITVDRYISVTSTVPGMKRMSYRRSIYVIVLIWLLSGLIVVPFMIYYRVVDIIALRGYEIRLVESGKHIALLEICMYSPPSRALKLSMSALQLIFLFFLPLVILLIFNTLLHQFIMQRRTRRVQLMHLTAAEDSWRRLSRLLAAMAFSYAALGAPVTILLWLMDYDLEIFRGNEKLASRLDAYCQFLAHSRIAVNPFLYAYMNRAFAKEFKRILHCILLRKAKSRKLCEPGRLTSEFDTFANNTAVQNGHGRTAANNHCPDMAMSQMPQTRVESEYRFGDVSGIED